SFSHDFVSKTKLLMSNQRIETAQVEASWPDRFGCSNPLAKLGISLGPPICSHPAIEHHVLSKLAMRGTRDNPRHAAKRCWQLALPGIVGKAATGRYSRDKCAAGPQQGPRPFARPERVPFTTLTQFCSRPRRRASALARCR